MVLSGSVSLQRRGLGAKAIYTRIADNSNHGPGPGARAGSGLEGDGGEGSGAGAGSNGRPRRRGKRAAAAAAAATAKEGKDGDGWDDWQGLVKDGYETVEGEVLDPWLLRTMADRKKRSQGAFVHMAERKKGRGEWAINEDQSAVFLMPGCYDPTLVGEDSRKNAPGALTAAAMAGVETVGHAAKRWVNCSR
ncbi:predicted protein [Chaetomium globosum CBS 148.51]|uniref:Uncharacterized protein n=1 Tax=Chaetomium globosum (strain ATCC 6205 / CBS 148.51 / DSM 1962 / NBRC 6347 / NRRL 1970) TaxID=306901 RepID=Q2GYM4_CHAGB|nr:uncharacterized protein CHGG_06930 [Chaetomium globosum CBS 148.51]EAQ85677.1 predicted protein [Chaetomium globosum CBS 148.51]